MSARPSPTTLTIQSSRISFQLKRKCPDDREQSKQPPSKKIPTTKTPLTFPKYLSLPLELRQQILLHASKPNDMDAIANIANRFSNLLAKVNTLKKVRPQVYCEVIYVEKQWAETIVKLEADEAVQLEAQGFPMGSEFYSKLLVYEMAVRKWDKGGRRTIYEC